MKYIASLKKKKGNNNNVTGEYVMVDHGGGNFSFSPDCLESAAAYLVQVKAVFEGAGESEWSDSVEFATLEFNECAWKECPDYVNNKRKYSVDEINSRISSMTGGSYCTIIGNTPLPLNKVISWSIKILKSRNNDGYHIYVGAAPSDINQNDDDNYYKCGWYFYCGDSTLHSGPPHNMIKKNMDQGKESGVLKNMFTRETRLALLWILQKVNFLLF